MQFFRKSVLTAGILAAFSAPLYAEADKESDRSVYEMLGLFGEVFERVQTDYVEDVSTQDLIESAINGMLVSLDPHSGYMNEKSFDEMKVQTKGEFGGLGIEVTMENGLVKVVAPIDDTPAFIAGVESADYISHIDGEPVMGLTLSEAVEKLRGPVGADVVITVLRQGETEPLEITIKRAVIKIRSVRSHREGDIGYVRITSFSGTAFEGMMNAIDELKKEIGDDKLKGIILDLRNNPGGLLDQAIDISDAFLEQGEIVSTRGRTEDSSHRFNARSGDVINGRPIVVLINGGSASASEIVAGALQDHHRALILGTQSFGKGSVQTVIPMDEHGAIRLTTSRYYTPSGRSIQAEGIAPDVIVEQSEVTPLKLGKLRKEADLRNSLENTDKLLDKADKKYGKTSKKEDEEDTQEEKSLKDYQLQRALDIILALDVYKDIAATAKTVKN